MPQRNRAGQTQQRAPYGRHKDETREARIADGAKPRAEHNPLGAEPSALRSSSSALQPYKGETYYGLPAIKPSHYNRLIAEYLFVGGLAGSAQVLAQVADLAGTKRHRRIVRCGRYLALAGALASPVLLIGDLHYRRRWFNMLRIFKATSPMSIGSWTLTGFGAFSSLAAGAQAWDDLGDAPKARRLARWAGLPAAIFGSVMSVYTGTLLAATSTPLWAGVYRLLPALFASSAASTASAALTLTLQATGAPEEAHRPLATFELVAAGAELALLTATRRQWQQQGLDEPLRRPPAATAFLGAIGLGAALPLVVRGAAVLLGRRSKRASTVAAVGTLLGGFMLRAVVLRAGNESARRPRDYFDATQDSPNSTADDKP
jgi:formate-dependent nitrite reductase membrane component NrfD